MYIFFRQTYFITDFRRFNSTASGYEKPREEVAYGYYNTIITRNIGTPRVPGGGGRGDFFFFFRRSGVLRIIIVLRILKNCEKLRGEIVARFAAPPPSNPISQRVPRPSDVRLWFVNHNTFRNPVRFPQCFFFNELGRNAIRRLVQPLFSGGRRFSSDYERPGLKRTVS